MEQLSKRQTELNNSFYDCLHTLRSLHQQATQEIIPDIESHHELSQEDKEWILDYLQDIGTLFRMFKRQRFIASFTYESLRNSVLWRLTTLKPTVSYDALHRSPSSTRIQPRLSPGLSALQFLPLNRTDASGRPMIVLRANELDFTGDLEQLKRDIILSNERIRVSLQRLNEKRYSRDASYNSIALQYCILVDVEDISMKSIPVELIRWYLKELQPWYYGVVGTVYVINYSWVHSGLWTVLKHLLPSSAVAKFVFLEKGDLTRFMNDDSNSIISTYLEGSRLTEIADIQPDVPIASKSRIPTSSEPSSLSQKTTGKTRKKLNRFSLNNPFFGYPIDTSSLDLQEELSSRTLRDSTSLSTLRPNVAVPSLRYGRRRKRDLVRALLVMYWQRWGVQLGIGATLLVLAGLLRARRKDGLRNIVLIGATIASRVKDWALTRGPF